MAINDFDFFHGEWIVHNRRLDERLTGCSSWSSFEAVCAVRPIALGFVDEITFPSLGYSGTNIGLYEPGQNRWAHYWVSSDDGVLQPPIYGGVTQPGLLSFYADEEFSGQPVRVRALWTIESTQAFAWEQAFQPAGGDWETNWHMTFTRK